MCLLSQVHMCFRVQRNPPHLNIAISTSLLVLSLARVSNALCSVLKGQFTLKFKNTYFSSYRRCYSFIQTVVVWVVKHRPESLIAMPLCRNHDLVTQDNPQTCYELVHVESIFFFRVTKQKEARNYSRTANVTAQLRRTQSMFTSHTVMTLVHE